MAGLTVAVLMFLLLVYIPGNVALHFAGRRRTERTPRDVLVVGSGVSAGVFLLVGCLQVSGKSDLFARFVKLVAAASGVAQAEPGQFLPLLWIFVAEYSTASLLGLLELLRVTGTPRTRGRRAVRLRPEDLLLELLVRYRGAGLKPFVTVYTGQGGRVTGECLRYGWNGKASLLVKDADDPEKLTWVDIEDVLRIEFHNRELIEAAEKEREREAALLQKLESLRKLYNWAADGCGDELYGERIENLRRRALP
ncbi:hypothetical protein Adeg_0742 [Ammonifex degensii KC4]|uniref:Uncharacterized protein n=1 Tax=Ammonifex degensii (strain DSM 10501 / KC4) TaxID=429009 RepID=C9RCB1_AMMDK|nr:hypothetical protein [Ammonifex degensii]ACX51888.1 hypothetical protein Adeg_0742 [Ammonifex degensii KC4]